jgi:conjugative relaxase-like TrwC/TraI family protein
MITCYDKFKQSACDMNARKYSQNDYYDRNHKVPGIVFGTLSREMGLEPGAVIEDKTFRALSLNIHPVTGARMTRHKEDRKLFCDVTCSIPKTFSVLGVLGGDARVFEYHRKAVEKVKAELHRIIGRQAHNGKEHLERTGNMVGVSYEHTANRCQEIQLHTHVLIFNVTQSENGKMYSVDNREFMNQRAYLTAMYRDTVAALAKEDGFNIEVGEYGQPEIVELIEIAKEHQQRTDEIKALVEEIEEFAGTKLTERETTVIVQSSRGLDVEEFKRLWNLNKDLLSDLRTLDPETAENDRRQVLENFREIVYASSERNLRKVSSEEVYREQQSRVTPEQRKTLEAIKATRAKDQERTVFDLDKAITYGIEHCFQNDSVVKDYELYEVILQQAQGSGVDLAEMRAKVASHPQLVRGTHSEIGAVLHYVRELESGNWIQDGKGEGIAIKCERESLLHLSKPQRNAVKSLLGCPDKFSCLSGSSGVGKTEYVLADIIKANVAAGYRVAVVAPSDAARDVLHEDASKLAPGAASKALQAGVSLQLYQADPRLHQELGPDDLLIIDESSFVSLEQGHAEFQRAMKGGPRVLLVGDVDQGKSIEAGSFMQMVMRMGIHTAELHDIRRQSPEALDGHYLKAIKLFKKGKTTEAFRELLLAGCIHEVKGKERLAAMADKILSEKAAGVKTLCANFMHRENDAISEVLREKMKALGQLRDERKIMVYGTLGWSEAQKKDVSKIKVGHVLEIMRGKDKGKDWTVIDRVDGSVYAKNSSGEVRTFTSAHYKLIDVCKQRELPVAIGDDLFARSANKRGQLINGEKITVAGWDEHGNPIDSNGKSVDHRNLCYAYASTSRKVQGSAKTGVITGFDRYSTAAAPKCVPYVILGRGREFCNVFVESIADLSQIQNRSGDRKDVTQMEIELAKLPLYIRRLAEKLQREPEKEKIKTEARDLTVDLQSEKRVGGEELERAQRMIDVAMAHEAQNQMNRENSYEHER